MNEIINYMTKLTNDEIKELLILYGYNLRTENVYMKEFNECQIVVRYLGDVFEFKVKSNMAFPTDSNDAIQLTVSTLHPEKLDLSKIESTLLTLFQQIQDFLIVKQ